MRMHLIAALVAGAAAVVSASAEAKAPRSVTCESRENKAYNCKIGDDYKRVELVRQISEERCIKGRTWWLRDDRIVVSKGCGAEFEVHEYGN